MCNKTLALASPIIGSIIAVVAVLLMNIDNFQATNMDPIINL